jgi:hypothetical protein
MMQKKKKRMGASMIEVRLTVMNEDGDLASSRVTWSPLVQQDAPDRHDLGCAIGWAINGVASHVARGRNFNEGLAGTVRDSDYTEEWHREDS